MDMGKGIKRLWQNVTFHVWLDGKGVVITAAVTAVVVAVLLLPMFRYWGTETVRRSLDGEIASVLTVPVNPELAVGRGYRYLYGVRSDDGQFIFVRSVIERPLKIGTRIKLEGTLRSSGIETFRIAEIRQP